MLDRLKYNLKTFLKSLQHPPSHTPLFETTWIEEIATASQSCMAPRICACFNRYGNLMFVNPHVCLSLKHMFYTLCYKHRAYSNNKPYMHTYVRTFVRTNIPTQLTYIDTYTHTYIHTIFLSKWLYGIHSMLLCHVCHACHAS